MTRFAIACALGVLALFLGVVVATSIGSLPIPIAHLFGGATEYERVVLYDVRMPRVVLAVITGGGLALSGAAMQGLFRNPLADPGFLGVSDGAALGAVIALYVGRSFGLSSMWLVPGASFAMALLFAFVVYAIATRTTVRGQSDPPLTTLLLAGIAIAAIGSALTSFVLSASLADWEVSREILSWLLGTLDGRSWEHVGLAAPLVCGGSALLMLYARRLDAMLLGEESALAVGVDVRKARRDVLVLVSLVTSATVAVVGVIGFVGLIVPHVVRLLVGPTHARTLPLSFLFGAIFVVLADLVCRLMPGSDLRIGIVTAIAGGPFFLYLLVRGRAR